MSLDKLESLAARGRALVRPPSRTGDWFRVDNAASERAEVLIYGEIGDEWSGGVTAASFVAQLREVTAPSIDLHINSPGGLVFDGIAIYSALRNHKAKVNVHVDGIAASAASFVAMAGDTVAIEKPAKMMIHDAQGLTLGGPAEHQEMLDLLNEMSDTIAEIYAARAGGPADEWRDAMRRESRYSAEQAVAAGLADRVVNDTKTAAPDNRRSQLIRARHRVHVAPRGG